VDGRTGQSCLDRALGNRLSLRRLPQRVISSSVASAAVFPRAARPSSKVLQILGKDISDWGVALWFTAANGWLDGKRPVDLLKDEPEEVIQAAEQEAADLVF
jgi:hypothetical protein